MQWLANARQFSLNASLLLENSKLYVIIGESVILAMSRVYYSLPPLIKMVQHGLKGIHCHCNSGSADGKAVILEAAPPASL